MAENQIRVINFGEVSWLDSQAIYHAVAHSFKPDSPDTITIMSPKQTYVSIGYFQELEKEVDLPFCKENHIPVIRREVGGGAVLLDSDQLFFHYIFNKDKLSRDVGKIYKKFLEPVTGAYRQMGLDVYHRPINDLHIDNKKIGGTGAVEIGNSMVVVGSFMFDFNYQLMPRILKVPSEKFRDKIYQNVKDYVTNIGQECKNRNIPLFGKEEIFRVFLEQVQKEFNRTVTMEEKLNPEEEQQLELLRKILTDESWLNKKGKFLDRKVKINADVNIYEGNHKCSGGLIRVTCATNNGFIDDINISGDFTLIPSSGIIHIENSLISCPLNTETVEQKISSVYSKYGIRSPGLEPGDLVEAIKTVLSDCF
ncbi:MAG: lipoate--protein ligase family protein [Actinomycetia bacterium]|nr:lipoate--protein ligase family protein [Actinomycetes bacterium]